MTKIYAALTGLCLSVLTLGTQVAWGQATPVIPHRTCGTQEADAAQQAELKRLNPKYDATKSNNPDPHFNRTAAVTYTLPVIVHVISDGEAVGVGSNIAAAQVQSQLDVLNEDYRNTNPDGASVPSVYQPLRADVQVQFVAATRDPNGVVLLEPGIDRVNRNTKGFIAPPYGTTAAAVQTYINNTVKPATYWDPNQYINIWVLNLGGGLLGYAQFPDNSAGLGGLSASGGSANTDGVVILYSAYGSSAKFAGGTYSAPYDKGRTLTHELGHWLGLRHIWGDGTAATCLSDYCADTPTQAAANFGCVAFPHVTCTNGTGDMSMNYMDYSDDACMYMFSGSQKDRMQAVMAANTPRRTDLLTSPAVCTSVTAAMASNSGTVCAGNSVTLTASGPAGATYTWSGPNNYSSTAQNPVLANVTTAMAGTYTVIVSVAGSSACAGRATTAVTVNAAPPTPTLASSATAVCPGSSAVLTAPNLVAAALPNEDFNGTAPGWSITSTGTAATTWQYSTSYTYSSTYLTLTNYSINGSRFAFSNSDAGGSGSSTNTSLVSPTFSTVGYGTLQVNFQQYLRYAAGDAATLEASIDGGTTWTIVRSFTATAGTVTAPAAATVDLSAYVNRASVKLRWHYVASWAYIWAVDNVQFVGTAAPPTYAWTLVSGDGLPATTNTTSLTVSPTQASVYRLTVSYPGSTCTSAATINVGIGSGTSTTTATNSGAVCPGSDITLTTPTIAGATYSWAGPNGYTSTAQSPVLSNVTTAMTGTYTVTAVTTTGSCTNTATATTSVVVNAAPPTPALVAASATVCSGTSTTLSATNLTGGSGTPVYAWSLVSGNGLPTTTTTATLTVTPTQASVYRLTVSYSGSTCTSTSTVSVGVNQTPPTPVLATTTTAVCPGSSATLSANNITGGSGTPVYAWTLVSGNGLPATTNTATLTVAPTQASVYRLTVTYSGTTCSSTATINVGIGSTTTTAANSGAVCPGGTVTLTTPTIAGATYSWTGPNGYTSTAQNPVLSNVTTAMAGAYTVTTSTGTSSTCPSTASTTVTLNAAPATPTIAASGTTGTGITLTSSSATGNQWYRNGVLITGATAQTYTILSGAQNGTYTVVTTNASGCASAPSAGFGAVVTATATAQAATALTIYPNPTTDGKLTVELTGYREAVQLTLSNALGQRVRETNVAPAALSRPQALDLSALPSGVYVLQARTASGGLEVRRIVRE